MAERRRRERRGERMVLRVEARVRRSKVAAMVQPPVGVVGLGVANLSAFDSGLFLFA